MYLTRLFTVSIGKWNKKLPPILNNELAQKLTTQLLWRSNVPLFDFVISFNDFILIEVPNVKFYLTVPMALTFFVARSARRLLLAKKIPTNNSCFKGSECSAITSTFSLTIWLPKGPEEFSPFPVYMIKWYWSPSDPHRHQILYPDLISLLRIIMLQLWCPNQGTMDSSTLKYLWRNPYYLTIVSNYHTFAILSLSPSNVWLSTKWNSLDL